MIKLLYATSNDGKAREVKKYLLGLDIELLTLKDLNITDESPETGETLEENALQKLEFYQKLAPEFLIITDDTGLEIDALHGQPGVHVRRWKDGVTKLSDDEAVEYCLEIMKEIPTGKRQAKFRTVIALGFPDKKDQLLFKGELNGEILKEIDSKLPLTAGVPFNRIFFVPEWQMTLGNIHVINPKELPKYKTHRARAAMKAVEYFKTLKN